mgnify:CR=1 FL=1
MITFFSSLEMSSTSSIDHLHNQKSLSIQQKPITRYIKKPMDADDALLILKEEKLKLLIEKIPFGRLQPFEL